MTAADIVALDIKAEARELAGELGAQHTLDPTMDDVAEVEAMTDGVGARQVVDFIGADETTALGPDVAATGGDHHAADYGGHVHEPLQALVDGELAYRGRSSGGTRNCRSRSRPSSAATSSYRRAATTSGR